MSAWLTNSLQHLYGDAFDNLETVLRACPDNLWTASLWRVNARDRHVRPIISGMGAELPEEERLQLHSAFCNIAFHLLFFRDHYLGGGLGEPNPPEPFSAERQAPHTLPLRVYTRKELLGYLAFCRAKAASVLAEMDAEAFERPARIARPFGDLPLKNLLQISDHTTQMNLS